MAKQEKNQYYEGVGRRKASIARVRIFEGEKEKGIKVGKRKAEEYFNTIELINAVYAPLEATAMKDLLIKARVKGGGQRGQADAIQLGLARALVKLNGEFQKTLRDLDHLKRDPRKKERKKPGLKKARRSPQWSKR